MLRLSAAAALLAAGIALLSLPATSALAAQGVSQPGAVMIVLDTNSSPGGQSRLSAERTAAETYVRALAPGVPAGLITFSSRWQLVLAPTAQHDQLTAALAAVVPGGPTSLGLNRALAGAAGALSALGVTQGDRLLVLSNGEDVLGTLAAGHIAIDVLTWTNDPDDNVNSVQALASATGGRVGNPAHAGALAGIVAGPAAAPSGPAKSGLAKSGPAKAASSTTSLPLGLMAAVFAAIFALGLVAIGALRQRDPSRGALQQLDRYGPRQVPAVGGEADGEGRTAAAALGVASRILRSSNAEPRLAARLEEAGITRKPAEWALLGGSATVLLVAALAAITRNLPVAVLIGAFCGWAAMRLLLTFRIARRRAAFADQLPDVLQLVAGSLQAGFSLPQALDGVAREDTQPSSGEISRAVAETRIGIDLETALTGIADRMDSDDLRWTVMAIRIQRQVGGNLAEVLRSTAATMRERAYLHRQVRALSGEGRLSAYILVGLPIVIGAWLFYSSPAYMRPLYTTPIGVAMLAGAAVLFVVGGLWMRVLIKVEV